MKNPWLTTPASDYEGHMSDPGVNQLSFLGEIFKDSLKKYTPKEVAILGCATGNGLEYIDNGYTKTVDAFDINPEYLSIAKHRFGDKIEGLNTLKVDLTDYKLQSNKYSLIFAGLIFEYIHPEKLLANIVNSLKTDGILISITQQPSEKIYKISKTKYPSLNNLSSIMKLIPDNEFKQMAINAGLKIQNTQAITLESGKILSVGEFRK